MAMPDRRLRPLPPAHEVDIRQIIQEAQTRWLRPMEVCEILRNYQKHNFKLNPVPPSQPPSGSLFLFDRKALRYFRKDGHNWRKKKDGKTVREAHERLKAGSVDVLHCYYAHGEENVNFQRRCYWMLDGSYEHIVLVHYREVTEGNRSCLMRTMIHDHATVHTTLPTPSPYSSPSVSMTVPPSVVASPETSGLEVNGPSHSPELEEADSGEGDEFEEPSAQEPEGVPPSLLEQIEGIVQGKLNAEAWPSSLISSSSGGMGGQVKKMSVYGNLEGDYKPSFPRELQQLQPRAPQDFMQEKFLGCRDVATVKSELSDLLDSPGPYIGASRKSSAAANLDLSGWSAMLHGSANRFAKPEVSSPSWAELFEQVTTPGTRQTLLDSIPGRAPNFLPQSPLGKEAHASANPPLKGIMEALAPGGLGREPQTVLEASIRAVTEGNVTKSAAEAHHRRWETSLTETPLMDVVSPSGHEQIGSQVLSNHTPWNSGTLEQVVQSAQPQQDPVPSSSKERNSWIHQDQPRPLPLHQYQHEFHHPQNLVNRLDQSHQSQLRQVGDHKLPFPSSSPHHQGFGGFFDNGILSPTISSILKEAQSEENRSDGMDSLKKLDSFGRWMNREMGGDTGISLLGGSGSFWARTTLEDQGNVGGLSSLSQHMQLDVDPSPSLSEQYFNISDFSPEWAFTCEETKVLIIGSFGDQLKNPLEYKWCCMFGEVEVPVEVVENGVLRCKAPPNIDSGRVPLYITRSDRQAHSQVCEFEYRCSAGSLENSIDSQSGILTEDGLHLQIRLARLLLESLKSEKSHGRPSDDKAQSPEDDELRLLDIMLQSHGNSLHAAKEQLLQVLLKHTMKEWLSSSLQEQETGENGPSNRDEYGQGVPHLAAALGYVWSIKPLLNSGVPINWRDKDGWTALHWAAHCGREQVVLELLAAGASAGAVTDPSKKSPAGLTPADLASASGHGGIAAYLAEITLTSRLSSISLSEGGVNEMDTRSAALAGEEAVAQLSRRASIQSTVIEEDDQVGIRQSLQAVRNAAQAAALIQSAFRQHSFRKRQESLHDDCEVDDYGLSQDQMTTMMAARRIQKVHGGHQQSIKQHLAATRIQQKFRGWKGRKDFLAFRQRIVKLQAHVRGRLVRKQFRKLLWSVGILEKAVLRWRRKRPGLRGFRAELLQPQSNHDTHNNVSSDDDEEFLKYLRRQSVEAVDKAVTRVQSMVRSRRARLQYQRLKEGSTLSDVHYLRQGSDIVPSSRDYLINHEDHIMSAAD